MARHSNHLVWRDRVDGRINRIDRANQRAEVKRLERVQKNQADQREHDIETAPSEEQATADVYDAAAAWNCVNTATQDKEASARFKHALEVLKNTVYRNGFEAALDDQVGSAPNSLSEASPDTGQERSAMIPPSDPDPVSDDEMADAMQMFGGAFVQYLGALWHHADSINRAKILATWPDLANEYRGYARLKRARQG